MTIDYTGLSVFIPAAAGAVISLGTFAMQVYNWWQGRKRDEKLKRIQDTSEATHEIVQRNDAVR